MAENQPRNVLFILSDQHNAKCLGHEGHPNVKTPHLDKLAAQGVRFSNAVTQSPICTPSRMSMISGQYCHNHGYYGLGGSSPAPLPTIFGHFRMQGYRTAAIGEIHCPDYWVEDDCDVFHDVTTACSVGGRSPQYTSYLRDKKVEHLEDHESLPEFGLAGKQSLDGRSSLLNYSDSCEGWTVQQSIAFMKQCELDHTPFFLHVSFPRPHQCFTPAKEFWDLYDPTSLELPPNAEYDMTGQSPMTIKAANLYRDKPWWKFEPRTFEAARLRRMQGYLGNISHVDHAVGELMAFLEVAGLDDNTIVVYGSDHGDYNAEHGLMEKSPGICHDAVTRVPLIWRCPDVGKAGHVAQEMVENIDVVPTLCSLAGLDPMPTADGHDLSNLLAGNEGELRRIAVTEFAWSRSVRQGRYRLVHHPFLMFEQEYPQGFGLLYDLETDPWEMHNLYFDNDHAHVVSRLKDELLDWLITTTRPRTVLGIPEASTMPGVKSDQIHIRKKAWAYADGKLSPDALNFAARQGGCSYL